MLTSSSSNNVVVLADHLDTETKPKAQWGKAGCSDWLFVAGQDMSAAEFKALFYLTRYANQWTGEVGHPDKGIGIPWLSYVSGMDERQVDRALTSLAKRGIIKKTPGKRGRGHGAKFELVSTIDRWLKDEDA